MIRNRTRRRAIIGKSRICRSILSKGTGLMFRRKPDYGLVFVFDREGREALTLTMLFVFFPIDVLFLDSGMRVVDMKLGFRPFTNYTPKCPARYVVELPAGLALGTGLGDIIEVEGLKP